MRGISPAPFTLDTRRPVFILWYSLWTLPATLAEGDGAWRWGGACGGVLFRFHMPVAERRACCGVRTCRRYLALGNDVVRMGMRGRINGATCGNLCLL